MVSLAAAAMTMVGAGAAAAADEAAAAAIRRAVQSATLPLMATEVLPLADTLMARKLLQELGTPRGFGDEWNPSVAEWKEAEALLVASPRAARKPKATGSRPPWPDCLEALPADELQRLAKATASPLWVAALREADYLQARLTLSMLDNRDESAAAERAEAARRVAAAAPPQRARSEESATVQLYDAAGKGKGAGCLVESGMIDVIARHGLRHQYELPRDLAKPYLDRFEARNRQLRVAWLVNSILAGNRPRVEELLAAGVELDAVAPTGKGRGTTPLYAASEQGPDSLAMTKLLIDRGADVNARNRNGETPLFAAACTRNVDVMELLLEKGADPNAKNNRGHDPSWILGRESAEYRLLTSAQAAAKGASPRPW
ncbi:MAG: ankyrin repeat domain-containing protein [Burkholderiales bacterium]|nr:ankyrin repeat domain-containing protein [Burkholderiales bacterium]